MTATQSYGSAKLVLREGRFWVETADKQVQWVQDAFLGPGVGESHSYLWQHEASVERGKVLGGNSRQIGNMLALDLLGCCA